MRTYLVQLKDMRFSILFEALKKLYLFLLFSLDAIILRLNSSLKWSTDLLTRKLHTPHITYFASLTVLEMRSSIQRQFVPVFTSCLPLFIGGVVESWLGAITTLYLTGSGPDKGTLGKVSL